MVAGLLALPAGGAAATTEAYDFVQGNSLLAEKAELTSVLADTGAISFRVYTWGGATETAGEAENGLNQPVTFVGVDSSGSPLIIGGKVTELPELPAMTAGLFGAVSVLLAFALRHGRDGMRGVRGERATRHAPAHSYADALGGC